MRPHLGEHHKAGGVLSALIDIGLNHLKAVECCSFRTGDSAVGLIPCFCNRLGGQGGVVGLLGGKAPHPDVVMALTECLGMAGHPLNVLHGRSGNAQKILVDLQLIDPVDIKQTGEDKIQRFPHLTGIAVLNRQYGHVAVAVDHRRIGRPKIAVRNALPLRENASRGDMGKGPLHAAVGHL